MLDNKKIQIDQELYNVMNMTNYSEENKTEVY